MKDKIINRLGELIQNENGLTNEEIIEIIEFLGNFLNLKTISDYAKENNLSYNGVKKFRKTIKLFGIKLVVDND